MENIVTCLEELEHESSVDQQRPFSRGENKISDVQTKCDSTVPETPQTTDQPVAEADDSGSHHRRLNASSSSSGLVSSGTSFSPNSNNVQGKLQAVETCQTEPDNEVEKLKAEVNSLRDDLRRSDEMVLLLKRHIELNSAADGSPLPSFSPDVIVALAQEVEKLNAELEKLSRDGRSNERTKELGSETESSSGCVQPVSGGLREPANYEARSRSSVSAQNLDSTLTDGEAAALDRSMKHKSASVDDVHQLCDKPRDKLSVKDALLSCDAAAAGDGATRSAHPLSAAFNISGDQRSFLGSPSMRNMLRQSIMLCHSPFDSTNAANQRAFAELQAEVERLRRRLELTELENSRLLERSVRESVGSFTIAPSVNPQADVSVSLDGSLVKYSASGDVTMAAGFLKKLVSVSISDLSL